MAGSSWPRRLRAAFFFLASACATASMAAWPEKPVKIVVPFAAGGATDVVARALGQRLGAIWKQPVVIENRPGAGGNIGADLVAKAAPDGYTLLLASPAEVAINEFLYKDMAFDPKRDLVPVSKVASAPLVLLVHPSVPAKTVPELIAFLKSNANGTPYASSGTGGPQHLAAEQFRVLTGTNLIHVPYKGGAPAITDLLGGQVRMFFGGLPPSLPHIKSGRLRALAVSTKEPSSLMEGVPPVADRSRVSTSRTGRACSRPRERRLRSWCASPTTSRRSRRMRRSGTSSSRRAQGPRRWSRRRSRRSSRRSARSTASS
ncbi:MAG TPA: tripartite tricarboxylate transporter substrate-binding protein [Usitatibacter sp.]|nr:tripartite tricarboxylate transporter substrate-binding protein [Usitatibacter sp.]